MLMRCRSCRRCSRRTMRCFAGCLRVVPRIPRGSAAPFSADPGDERGRAPPAVHVLGVLRAHGRPWSAHGAAFPGRGAFRGPTTPCSPRHFDITEGARVCHWRFGVKTVCNGYLLYHYSGATTVLYVHLLASRPCVHRELILPPAMKWKTVTG